MVRKVVEKVTPSSIADSCSLIFFADTHQNHVMGLCPPNVEMSNGEFYPLSPVQKVLLDAWQRTTDSALEVSKDWPRVGFGVGDLIDGMGDTRIRSELVTQNPDTALKLVVDTLSPLTKEFQSFFVIEGTGFHVGDSAWTEKRIARDLKAIPDPETKSPSWQRFVGKIGGLKLDVDHHPGGNSNVKRNYPSVASRLSYDILTEYIVEWEEDPPNLAVRAHNHRFADSGVSIRTRTIILPCYQLRSVFINKMGKGYEMPHLGCVVVLADRGKYELVPILAKMKGKTTWQPPRPKK